MLAAIMTGTFATGHITHTDPTPFPAHITVFSRLAFGISLLLHPDPVSLSQLNFRRKAMRGRRQYGANDCGVAFRREALDIQYDGMARKSERASILKRRAELTLIGNREGSLSYELTPWQMRADGCLWIGTPPS